MDKGGVGGRYIQRRASGDWYVKRVVSGSVQAKRGTSGSGCAKCRASGGGRKGGFAIWTEGLSGAEDVIFTTVAKWGSDTTATPTRVGRKEVEEAGNCCIFYIF